MENSGKLLGNPTTSQRIAMQIVFVFPPFYHPSMYNLPPLGLLNLAATMRESPHRPVILDFVLALRDGSLQAGPALYDDCARRIAAEAPDLVAFSAQCTTYPPTIAIARRVRELAPAARIVIGGHNASFVDSATLERYPWIDAVIRGEGEITFGELVSAWAGGGDAGQVAGVTWRGSAGIVRNPERELIRDLDTLPLPDYGLLPPLAAYRDACGLSRSIAILEVGRGCPHRCVYCSESSFWRRHTRTFSIDRLAREMRQLRDGHGAECFLLAYDQFTADRRFVERFCTRLLDEGLQSTPWYCISRLDTVDAALLKLMRQAGCESMCYGIDSGSPRTLAFIRKHIDPAILLQRVQATTAQGMVPTLSFVIGFPEENREDIEATLELALRSAATGNINPLLQMPTVLPGTELHQRYAKRLVREVDTYFALGIEFAGNRRLDEDEARIDGDPQLYSSFYNLPCPALPLPELDRLARFFPLLVQFYPRSCLLLARALGRPLAGLFANFFAFVQSREQRLDALLSAADCYQHFALFAEEQLERARPSAWPHLPDLIAYETHSLEVARFANREIPGNMDIYNPGGWQPAVSRNVLVAGFRYDLPAILADLGAGDIRERYPEAPCWLVFRQQGNELEVTAINDFGRDLLELCNGSLTTRQIADRLRLSYGATTDPDEFDNLCRQALRQLADLRLVAADDIHESSEGR
jgi:radical SAM superfamily enzyme YgiQ (UPF0313 family)